MSETNNLLKLKKKKIKIVLVDDHLIVRRGFRHLLHEIGDYKVVGEAANGKELLLILPELSPDIILLDIEMPKMNGYETLQKIAKQYPEIKTIILSGYYSETYTNEFLKYGARAYVPKACDIQMLVKVIQTVHSDGYCISKKASEQVASAHLLQLKANDLEQMALTDKEISVLKLLCDGLSSKQIASRLNLDFNTINFHKRNIYKKTNLQSVGPLVKYAIRNGYTML